MDRKTVTLLSFFLWKIVIRDKKIMYLWGNMNVLKKVQKIRGYNLENREMD